MPEEIYNEFVIEPSLLDLIDDVVGRSVIFNDALSLTTTSPINTEEVGLNDNDHIQAAKQREVLLLGTTERLDSLAQEAITSTIQKHDIETNINDENHQLDHSYEASNIIESSSRDLQASINNAVSDISSFEIEPSEHNIHLPDQLSFRGSEMTPTAFTPASAEYVPPTGEAVHIEQSEHPQSQFASALDSHIAEQKMYPVEFNNDNAYEQTLHEMSANVVQSTLARLQLPQISLSESQFYTPESVIGQSEPMAALNVSIAEHSIAQVESSVAESHLSEVSAQQYQSEQHGFDPVRSMYDFSLQLPEITNSEQMINTVEAVPSSISNPAVSDYMIGESLTNMAPADISELPLSNNISEVMGYESNIYTPNGMELGERQTGAVPVNLSEREAPYSGESGVGEAGLIFSGMQDLPAPLRHDLEAKISEALDMKVGEALISEDYSRMPVIESNIAEEMLNAVTANITPNEAAQMTEVQLPTEERHSTIETQVAEAPTEWAEKNPFREREREGPSKFKSSFNRAGSIYGEG